MAGRGQKSSSVFWIYVGLAVAAGLTLGSLIFTWIRPSQTARTADVSPAATAAIQTVSPTQTDTRATTIPEAVPEAQPKAKQMPSTMHDRTEARQRGLGTKGSAEPSPVPDRGRQVTEKAAAGAAPVLTSSSATSVPSRSSDEPPAPNPGKRKAVQETDSEGITAPSSGGVQRAGSGPDQGADPVGRPVLRRAESSAGDSGSSEATTPAPQSQSVPQLPPSGVSSARPAYNGPRSGVATWTGKLDKDQTLAITGGTPSIGVLAGAGLPGVPVQLTVDQSNLGFTEMPNAANGYRRVVLKSHSKHDRITLRWTVQ